jgi:flagellar motility protein MotE (MotC chaperone)
LGNGITSDPAGTGRLKLTGEGADVEINGKSLSKTIQALEQRLNMLVPNPELETEWEELRKLGEQYRALEAKLTEQGEMWTKLKAMPPPEIE